MVDSSRYARQIQYPPIGESGQAKLSAASVLVLGVGALGTVAAELLTRAGVGRLRLVDRDTVEWSNLQRQSLFVESDAEQELAKADAAVSHLRRINSQIHIEAHAAEVSSSNILEFMSDIDLVIDATDNFPTRMLLNDASVKLGLPWVHGGCVGSHGQVGFFSGTDRPCFRCLVPQLPATGSVATCDTAGVVGAATHLIASLQVGEAIKWIVGSDALLRGKIQTVNLWESRFAQIDIESLGTAACPVCEQRKFDFLDAPVAAEPTILCGRLAVQVPASDGAAVDFSTMEPAWRRAGTVSRNAFLMRVVAENHSVTLFRDGRAIISGTDDIPRAKAIYAKFVGT